MAKLQERPNEMFEGIENQVVLITGGSSGIGRATAELCVQLGAIVVIGDLNPPPNFEETARYKFLNVDVSQWESVHNFFSQAESLGEIDHVFVNAGVGPTTDFLDHSLDENGQLLPPNLRTINVNLVGVIYTTWLATYYAQKTADGHPFSNKSIVLTASASSFQNFGAADYATAKHGVLGILRGLVGKLEGKIRLNAIAPSWTATGVVPVDRVKALGAVVQDPEVVARSVVDLFTDTTRHGDVVYSRGGKCWEINRAEDGLLAHATAILGDSMSEGEVYQQLS